MARPLRKRQPPKPQPITLRRVDVDEPVEIVPPDELARRKEEAEWQRYRRSHGLDVREEHARLALRLGDPVEVPIYTHMIWWLVRDVNGPERTVTAGTLIFDRPRERTFPFDLVKPVRVWGPYERNEAARWFAVVEHRLGKLNMSKQNRAA